MTVATSTDVLRTHRHLWEVMANPNPRVRKFYDDFFSQGARRAMRGSPEMQNAWFSMLFPAQSGAEFLAMVRKPLYAAPCYQVTAKVIGIVNETYERSTQTQRIEERDLPSATGFIWLDEPLFMTDKGGARIATRAFSWGPQPQKYVSTGDGYDETNPPGMRITSWCYTDDQDDYTDAEAMGWLISMDMKVSISHSQYVPWGSVSHSRIPGSDVTPDDILRWLHTLWLFMATEVMVTEQEAPARPERKRAHASIGTSLVNVVLLRRVKVVDREDGEARDVDWTCSWFRQSHWRHLESYEGDTHRAAPSSDKPGHCVVCERRITFVRTHICDPAGKPLKIVPEVLYRVSR
jgi:hypothetical protein